MIRSAQCRSTQCANPVSAIEDYLAALCGSVWDEDSFELCVAPHFSPRMLAWSLSLSSFLWCSLLFAGHELWKVWR